MIDMAIKLVMIILILLLSSCTVIRFDQAPESEAHVTVMPATQTSVMSAADGQWSDRAQRAGEDASDEMGDTTASQTATAVPTVSIPLTGASPAAAAAGVERYFEGEVALPEVVQDELLPPEDTDTGKKSKDKEVPE